MDPDNPKPTVRFESVRDIQSPGQLPGEAGQLQRRIRSAVMTMRGEFVGNRRANVSYSIHVRPFSFTCEITCAHEFEVAFVTYFRFLSP